MSGNNYTPSEDMLPLEITYFRDSDWTYKSKEPAKYAELYQKKTEVDQQLNYLKQNRNELFKKLENFEEVENDLYEYFFEDIDEDFKNPKLVEADKLVLYVVKGNGIMEIRAISNYWTDNWSYGYYEDSISSTELNKLTQGFAWLAKLPFYRFWSQIIYVKNTLKAIKSFIIQKNLYFYSRDDDSSTYNQRYRNIYQNLFQILLRLVQTEPSKVEKLTSRTHKFILKNKKIFSHDMILPICRLYGNTSHTKFLFHQLFVLQPELCTQGLAAVAIECQNVLPLLSNHLQALPELLESNSENVFLAYITILCFIEDVCAIQILLENYPPFQFVLEYLQLDKQLMKYVGYHLFEVGKNLYKMSATGNTMGYYSYLYNKFMVLSKRIFLLLRRLINKAIQDLQQSNGDKRDPLTDQKLKQGIKRYVNLLEEIFSCNFYGFLYVKHCNVALDNAKIIKAYPNLSSSQRSILMSFEKIAEEFKKENCLQPTKGICIEELSEIEREIEVQPLDIEEKWKDDIVKAIAEQQIVFRNNLKETSSDKLIEKLMTKGFVGNSELFSVKTALRNQNNSITSFAPCESLKNNVPQSILIRLKKIRREFADEEEKEEKLQTTSLPNKTEESEFSSRRLLETKFDLICQKFKDYKLGEPAISVEETVTPAAQEETFNDDAGAIKRAISESMKVVRDPSPINDVVFQSLITEVKDILPHLGEGFIQKCLEFYDKKTDIAISAILEDRLDPSLQCIDQTLPIIPPEAPEPIKRTVFENDSLHQMVENPQQFDPSRVFRKKNKIGTTAASFLNDKSHIRSNAEMYQKYSLDYYNDDYDDEYEDVEPDLARDEPHSDEGDGPLNKPKKRGPRRFHQQGSSSSEESDDDKPVRNPLDFCEDPSVIRARAEAARNLKSANRSAKATKPKDVVGNPKGQGQDKNVLINRAKKNENKSQKANHNRRSGAQWKRNRGMIPS